MPSGVLLELIQLSKLIIDNFEPFVHLTDFTLDLADYLLDIAYLIFVLGLGFGQRRSNFFEGSSCHHLKLEIFNLRHYVVFVLPLQDRVNVAD